MKHSRFSDVAFLIGWLILFFADDIHTYTGLRVEASIAIASIVLALSALKFAPVLLASLRKHLGGG